MIGRSLSEPLDAATYGAKAAQLSKALAAGLPVPPGRALAPSLVEDIAQTPDAWVSGLALIHSTLGGDVAVRSSAIGEDSESTSFAGVHETILHCRRVTDVVEAISRVHHSAQTQAARTYRMHHGMTSEPAIGAVIQQMVNAQVSGVLFTRDPVSGADLRVIEASWGLGAAVVAGLVEPDRVLLGRNGAVVEQSVGFKDVELLSIDGQVRECEVPAPRRLAMCLSDRALQALQLLTTTVERVFEGRRGHDLEFAFDHDGQLWLLQRREVTR